nr:hypothetical protein [Candidatus Burkholderia verschuerenii]
MPLTPKQKNVKPVAIQRQTKLKRATHEGHNSFSTIDPTPTPDAWCSTVAAPCRFGTIHQRMMYGMRQRREIGRTRHRQRLHRESKRAASVVANQQRNGLSFGDIVERHAARRRDGFVAMHHEHGRRTFGMVLKTGFEQGITQRIRAGRHGCGCRAIGPGNADMPVIALSTARLKAVGETG